MFYDPDFEPLHITATHEDMCGNDGRGRYIFVPGSDGRAKKISEYFDQVTAVRKSSRGHNLYIGTITRDGTTIDIGVISTGMGAPSVDIILNELLKLGGKKFLRLGTCGLLQPAFMKGGDHAIATAAIRDDHATRCYVPAEYPASASMEMVQAAVTASEKAKHSGNIHVGIFHSKDSLYAREFKQGAMAEQNSEYMAILKRAGAVASEMEASMIFTLCNMADAHRQDRSLMSKDRVLCGTICGVLGEEDDFGHPDMVKIMTDEMVEIGIQTFVELNRAGL
ncbi:nucleoside phosphorylase [Lentisphaerota bacterium ZTH]|nr:nucleoside phosphorylase [Lentisphaerota bacterium]WET05631.1 nucleoside phosphorylase [Lentisphaerota bacterium ZTH]